MTTNLRIVLIVISLIYIIFIVKEIKKNSMQGSFSTFWIISSVLLIIAAAIPNFVESITDLLGFETTSNMLFCFTIFIAFYLIFNLTIKLSKVYRSNVSLVQEVSLLKERVEKLEKDKED